MDFFLEIIKNDENFRGIIRLGGFFLNKNGPSIGLLIIGEVLKPNCQKKAQEKFFTEEKFDDNKIV